MLPILRESARFLVGCGKSLDESDGHGEELPGAITATFGSNLKSNQMISGAMAIGSVCETTKRVHQRA